mmetsp:Transcript_13322/g.26783  ORF Transcript_13322/g.26783 Transcript_13322/m.26783 type:complete len:94 (-) Transcript_13322:493-774(-)
MQRSGFRPPTDAADVCVDDSVPEVVKHTKLTAHLSRRGARRSSAPIHYFGARSRFPSGPSRADQGECIALIPGADRASGHAVPAKAKRYHSIV